MRKPHTLNAAETSRESFSKAIYDRLFTWIVGHVNSAIDPALTGIFCSHFLRVLAKFKSFCILLHQEKYQETNPNAMILIQMIL